MAKQGDVVTPRDKILLNMICRILRRVNAHGPTTMRTIRRRHHLDERVIRSRCRAKPAGMADRSAPLPRLSLGRAFRGLVLDGMGLSLAIRGKLGLPLELELEFQTLNLSFERLVLGHQIRDRLPRGVQLAMEQVQAVTARVRQIDQSPSAAPPRCGQWPTCGQPNSCLG